MREIERFFDEIFQFNSIILYSILAVLLLYIFFKRKLPTYHSRWSKLIDGLDYSSEAFYKQLKEELHGHNIKKISTQSVLHKEGSMLSSNRNYLRVSWKGYTYDICGAPFGNGFFVSWWLFQNATIGEILIYKIPFIGKWLSRKLFPVTMYSIDTASMFMSYAQQSVLNVIDDITETKGIRKLSEYQRTPILQDFFDRKKQR
ncbi:MAG: hypothetical protein ACK5M1_07710 [Xanthomarina gelatinilytica]|uniref:hypothetical protein n=1 Tax=Xanthomarina gelatinilytica TaxID=1137281 RepID=UPI003A864579